jgi:hypothetical protein
VNRDTELTKSGGKPFELFCIGINKLTNSTGLL